MIRYRGVWLSFVLLVTACGGGDDGATMTPDASTGADATVDGPGGEPTAADLLAALGPCSAIGGPYATDDDEPATIDVCGEAAIVFWTADLDVDCDGVESAACNSDTDPAYQDQTAATDSHGDPLDAAALPYVVFPGASARWDYKTSMLGMGSVVAVIYGDVVEYGVAGDVGPVEIIGEASYRMAEVLGIDPDPATGGADGGVTYIAFTGPDAKVTANEDHDEARRIGIAHARALLGQR